ncbi:MAG TPA: hypothetical protein VNO55_32080 [Polyangia bacterium]|nr:hypothetical protein [Polyangia bacterium]
MLRVFSAVFLIAACSGGKSRPLTAMRSPIFDGGPLGEFVASDWQSLRKARCEVHGGTLITAIVPATTGEPDYDHAYVAASQRLFPNANISVGLGCLGPEAARVRAKYCAECRRIRGAWMAEHPQVDSRGYRLTAWRNSPGPLNEKRAPSRASR